MRSMRREARAREVGLTLVKTAAVLFPSKLGCQVEPVCGTAPSLGFFWIRYQHTVRPCSSSTSAAGEGEQTQESNHCSHSHHEHWNRSSLIMLAVAQASPRGHNAPPPPTGSVSSAVTTPAGGQCSSLADSTTGIATSPSKTLPPGCLDASLPRVEEVPSLVTDSAPKVDEKHSSLEVAASSPTSCSANGRAPNSELNNDRDGHYFLNVVEATAAELRARVAEIENDLQNNELSDEVSGHLRTTVGKVNLLLSQKFVQFRSLCMDSIEPPGASNSVGEFVTLPSDLEGFWAMVMLQVDDVRSMIARVDQLRQNGWQANPDPPTHNGVNGASSITPMTVKRRQPKPAASTTSTPRQNKEAVDLARSQARERLKAAKRQYMLARQRTPSTTNALETENASFLVL
ncbi:unnamed protein product [Mesocestoides corti]|uniref:Uncharacterized protein n=2 Tax=Mesocestoides corti TaxID=53468 RepID=A0A158QW96_MESCO|nr:unnamed protein product [Mesocestoides corti]